MPEPAAAWNGHGFGNGGEGVGASRQVPTPPTEVSGAVIRVRRRLGPMFCERTLWQSLI
jgi:hypothetical protein